MKRFFACLILFLALGTLTAHSQETKWLKISPKEGNCEILFPAQPKEMVKQKGTQLMLEREGGKAGLMFEFETGTTIDISNPRNGTLVFDAVRGGMLKAVKGAKLLSEKNLMVDKKYPTRDVVMEIPALGIYRVRLILTNQKLYQITVIGPKDYQDRAEAKQFRESFKFTK